MIYYYEIARPTPAPESFTREGWIFELKYDGFRILASVPRGEPVRMTTRSGNDIAHRFPEIVADLKELPECVLDGELVVCDERGIPQFARLSRRAHLQRPDVILHTSRIEPAVLFAFDLLWLKGEDLRKLPLLERKVRLKELLRRSKRVRYLNHIETEGERFFAAAAELELEGIVAKRADSPYPAGRTRNWLKIKTGAGRENIRARARWNVRPMRGLTRS